jgi:hypothetical protein
MILQLFYVRILSADELNHFIHVLWVANMQFMDIVQSTHMHNMRAVEILNFLSFSSTCAHFFWF